MGLASPWEGGDGDAAAQGYPQGQGSSQGVPGAAQCCTALPESFCISPNWGSPGLGHVEELEVEGCAGWLWGKLWQLHPWIPPVDSSQCWEHPEKPSENDALDEENM